MSFVGYNLLSEREKDLLHDFQQRLAVCKAAVHVDRQDEGPLTGREEVRIAPEDFAYLSDGRDLLLLPHKDGMEQQLRHGHENRSSRTPLTFVHPPLPGSPLIHYSTSPAPNAQSTSSKNVAVVSQAQPKASLLSRISQQPSTQTPTPTLTLTQTPVADTGRVFTGSLLGSSHEDRTRRVESLYSKDNTYTGSILSTMNTSRNVAESTHKITNDTFNPLAPSNLLYQNTPIHQSNHRESSHRESNQAMPSAFSANQNQLHFGSKHVENRKAERFERPSSAAAAKEKSQRHFSPEDEKLLKNLIEAFKSHSRLHDESSSESELGSRHHYTDTRQMDNSKINKKNKGKLIKPKRKVSKKPLQRKKKSSTVLESGYVTPTVSKTVHSGGPYSSNHVCRSTDRHRGCVSSSDVMPVVSVEEYARARKSEFAKVIRMLNSHLVQCPSFQGELERAGILSPVRKGWTNEHRPNIPLAANQLTSPNRNRSRSATRRSESARKSRSISSSLRAKQSSDSHRTGKNATYDKLLRDMFGPPAPSYE
eukprot:GILK01013478.1.p1 GENE.GILK01013478.1~~GILK01013478.1.p1  ORF type:complete len:536 (-),score=81.65 GILK01013478.1:195-1802(-)